MFQFLRKEEVNTLRYIPTFLSQDSIFKNTAKICNDKHEELRLKLIDIAKQFFIETCTWGLDDWERVLDITTIKSDSYALRRNRILLKLQGWKTSTERFMNELLNRYTTSKNAYIVEHNKDFYFEIVLNVDTVENWSELVAALFTYKPAHLGMFIAMQIIMSLKIQHQSESTQIVDANHNVWNLGAVKFVRRDGIYYRNKLTRRNGIQPDGGYRTKQNHRAEIDLLVDSTLKNNGQVINFRDNKYSRNGSHRRNGIYREKYIVSNYCTVSYIKNGVEVTECV